MPLTIAAKRTPITVCVLADNDVRVRKLEQWIRRNDGFKYLSSYTDEELASREIPIKRPGLVILDSSPSGFRFNAFLPRLKKMVPQTRILVLVEAGTSAAVLEALAAGADGILSPDVLESKSHSKAHEILSLALSARELQIAKLWSQGLADKQIAGELSISIETVRTHAKRIFIKLNVHTRTEACRKIWENRQSRGSGRCHIFMG